MNPIIKFTTLFGLLAVEIAVSAPEAARIVGLVLFVVGLYFVWNSFYGMRISSLSHSSKNGTGHGHAPKHAKPHHKPVSA